VFICNRVQAAEQCERLSIPRLPPPTALQDVLATWQQRHPNRRLYVCQERSPHAPPLFAALSRDAADSGAGGAAVAAAAFLIGPEGGFSTGEREALAAARWARPVSLGSTVLRAETAALYALACYSSFVASSSHGGGDDSNKIKHAEE
jgi:16S rRNA (uracil1498-N3)-methyltransferase